MDLIFESGDGYAYEAYNEKLKLLTPHMGIFCAETLETIAAAAAMRVKTLIFIVPGEERSFVELFLLLNVPKLTSSCLGGGGGMNGGGEEREAKLEEREDLRKTGRIYAKGRSEILFYFLISLFFIILPTCLPPALLPDACGCVCAHMYAHK